MTDSSKVSDADETTLPFSLPSQGHEPVLLNPTLDLLSLAPRKTIVDCTLGRGGHAAAIAERLGNDGTLIALDADPRNLNFARRRLASAPCRVRFFHANFAELPQVLEMAGISAVDGILADLGISTNQLFESEYGMSFGKAMPLDMRIDPRTPLSAADIVNKTKEDDLANVLYELAQERYSRRIARKIVEARRHSPIMTTDRLADLVRSAIPSRGGAPDKIDPATRTFLALRMRVNRELENLASLLKQAPLCLTRGGRLAVISFQSTEDRVVKQAFRSAERAGLLRILTKKPIPPTESEIAANPRSRSAKLRAAARDIDGSSGV
ncbi:MAG TPA: 16S rRNA (cytosine(1402)-N(4))-methyltransferase RsmH [Tepidisphaeraceae bacterium]|jgi:16S rRNA (cytosine1402-N4)-methyltransferase|nr:16S rRNA (cytosine(1402)-N(4))-methyltransferase RsmH [Tepidisphaeraceae bacterium]